MSTVLPVPSANDLREVWRRVSRQNLALGAACGCSFGFSISANELEEDICDFVMSAAAQARRQDVIDLVAGLRGEQVGGSWTLSQLFEKLADSAYICQADFVLPRLAGSLGSLENVHGRASFRCE